MLPAPLADLDTIGLLLAALDAVAFQHQMAVVGIDIAGKSVERYTTLPTDLDVGEVGSGVQLQCRTIFRFSFGLAPSYSVTFIIFQGFILCLQRTG